MGKLDKLKAEYGANVAESTGGPSEKPTGKDPATPAARPARTIGVERSKAAAVINIAQIAPDPSQPRKEFDEAELAQMAESLAADGQIMPIRVSWDEPNGRWLIVDGERRYRGAMMAGVGRMDCVIEERELTPGQRLKVQMIANVVREDLKPIEQADAMRRLMESEGWSGSQLARELKMSQSKVAKALSLLKLAPEVQESVDRGELPSESAYQISRLEDPGEQREVADLVVAEKLTDKQAAEEVNRVVERGQAEGKAADPKKGRGKGRASRAKRVTSRAFNISGIRILAESSKGIEAPTLLEALRIAASRVEAEIEPAVA